MKKVFCIFILVAIINKPTLYAQSFFSRSFVIANDNDGNTGMNIHKTADGYELLVGRKNDFGVEYCGVAQINDEAELIYSKTYYLQNQEYPPDPGLSMVKDESYIYIGCQYQNPQNELDIELLCIDQNTLDTVWVKKYPRLLNDYILYTLETFDNSILLVSGVEISATQSRLRIIKTDKSGNVIWDNLYTGFNWNAPWQACIAKDGSVLVVYEARTQGVFGLFSAISKISSDGQMLWTKSFPVTESGISVPTIAQLDNGDIAFGHVRDTFAPGGQFFDFPPTVYILDSLGNQKSFHRFLNERLRLLTTLRTLPNGDLLGIGVGDFQNQDSPTTGGWLFRMSPTGEVLWERVIFDNRYAGGEFLDAIATDDDGILATGYTITKDVIPGDVRVWMVKIGEDGCYGPICDQLDILITPSSEAPLPDKNRYRIVPNPADQYLRIEGLTGIEERRLEIYTTSGRLVRQTEYPQPGDIQVNDLPPGIYTLKITLKNNYFATLQFIKL